MLSFVLKAGLGIRAHAVRATRTSDREYDNSREGPTAGRSITASHDKKGDAHQPECRASSQKISVLI